MVHKPGTLGNIAPAVERLAERDQQDRAFRALLVHDTRQVPVVDPPRRLPGEALYALLLER